MIRKMKRSLFLLGAVALFTSGCAGNKAQNSEKEYTAAVYYKGTTRTEASNVQGGEQSSLIRTEIIGLEEGLRGWYLSSTDGKDPIIECIKENGWDGYSGAGGAGKQVSINSYTMYTLKEYVIRIGDRSEEACTFSATAHFEEYGELIIEISREKSDSADSAQEVNLLFVAERPINKIVYMLDGECISEEDSPYFGMYYPE